MSVQLRSDLPPLPKRMRGLPLDERGYPIPWFVGTLDGKRDFRVMDPERFVAAVRRKLCWVCGNALGTRKVFVIGPMCAVNRTTSEPPCHLECAEYSARACPFLSMPKAQRREVEGAHAAGRMICRNPGVCALWVSRDYQLFRAPNGPLIHLGAPESVLWRCEGREATREEVEESLRTGLPVLLEMAEKQGPHAVAALALMLSVARKLLPERRAVS